VVLGNQLLSLFVVASILDQFPASKYWVHHHLAQEAICRAAASGCRA
jgi:hypothetical protein